MDYTTTLHDTTIYTIIIVIQWMMGGGGWWSHVILLSLSWWLLGSNRRAASSWKSMVGCRKIDSGVHNNNDFYAATSLLWTMPLSMPLLSQVFAVCLVLASTCALAQANPDFGKPIYGEKYLNRTQTFSHGWGVKPSTISYNIEHHDDVVHFRQAKYGVKNAKCTEKQMILSFAEHNAMKEFYTLVGGVKAERKLIAAPRDMNESVRSLSSSADPERA